jgi:hypothetical protein
MDQGGESKSQEEVTGLLQAWSQGNQAAFNKLIVYSELRRLARTYMARERRDHTLQPRALVHEAYLRLADFQRPALEKPNSFLRHLGASDEARVSRFCALAGTTEARRKM